MLGREGEQDGRGGHLFLAFVGGQPPPADVIVRGVGWGEGAVSAVAPVRPSMRLACGEKLCA